VASLRSISYETAYDSYGAGELVCHLRRDADAIEVRDVQVTLNAAAVVMTLGGIQR
jgi:hypothetical protein